LDDIRILVEKMIMDFEIGFSRKRFWIKEFECVFCSMFCNVKCALMVFKCDL